MSSAACAACQRLKPRPAAGRQEHVDARLAADDRADLLAAAEESLDRLAHLAASLLDVSRLQAGGGGLTMVLTLPAAPARPAAETRGTRRIRAA